MAETEVRAYLIGSPVFRLRSKRGKLLLEISRRNVWPFRKTLLVAQRSTADLVDLAWIHQPLVLLRIPVAHPENAFRQILREAIRTDVHQLPGEVRIHCGRFDEQSRSHRAGHFEVVRERTDGINQNILAILNRTLVARARFHVLGVAAAAGRPSWAPGFIGS